MAVVVRIQAVHFETARIGTEMYKPSRALSLPSCLRSSSTRQHVVGGKTVLCGATVCQVELVQRAGGKSELMPPVLNFAALVKVNS